MSVSRRSVLKRGAVSLAAAIGGFPAIVSRRALADTMWGDVPDGILPTGYQPKSILEIHCVGAPSIWESFWVTVQNGTPNWRGFDSEMAASQWLCPPAVADRPGSLEVKAFGTDSLGNTVHWGPATSPLWDDAIFSRIRMVVQKHDNPAIPIHEAAIPFAVTGTRLGNPRHAATGAAFQHRGRVLAPDRTIPHAYALSPTNNFNLPQFDQTLVATGQHPGGSRPLLIRIGGSDALIQRLSRSNKTGQSDALLDALRGQYRDRLRHHGGMVPVVRSGQYSAYDSALDAVFGAPELQALFAGDVLVVDDTPYCVKETGDPAPDAVANRPATAIDLARRLLTDPVSPARHVIVGDMGVENIAGGGQPCYDVHASLVVDGFEMVRATTANLFNMMDHLARAIDPSGTDPTRINLDDTMIVINTEFGRTAERSSDDGISRGREHNPGAYVAVLIGGPINSRAIVGGITSTPGDSGDGVAPDNHWHKPTDVRGAILLAGGIWPFESELFGTLDFGPRINVGTEIGNAQTIVTALLGL